MIEHLFNYVTGNLTDVTFNVYAAEAIRAADGVSADYYAADELVGSITTDGNGIAQMDNLPLGRYYIVEKETAHGYVLDNEPRYVDLTYRDQDTPLVTYSADWQNARQRVQVEVLEKKKRTVTKYFPGQSLASMQQTISYLLKEKYSLRKTP